MKILMTTDTVGGVWTYALDLARGLDRHGVDVLLATMGPPPGEAQRDELRASRNIRLAVGDYRLEWMPDPWNDVNAAGEWLLALEREFQPDVVHLNGYAHAALAWSSPCLVAAHSCVCSWWRDVHGTDAPPEWDRYRAAVRAGLHAADIVVAPTRALLREVCALHGEPAHTCVIPNGRDLDRLPLGARDAFGRYARTDALPQPLVLAAGRLWDPAKNIETLAAAATGIPWPVFVAGSAVHPAGGIRNLPGVHHLGALGAAAMRGWYRRASVFAHTPLYEPFGLAPLEAAQNRCALVLSDIPTLREIWQGAATFVPPRDADGLRAAVNRLIADPLLLADQTEAALQRARTFTTRRMAGAYYGVYRTLRSAGRSTPQGAEVVCAS
jgi:glycogen synthase